MATLLRPRPVRLEGRLPCLYEADDQEGIRPLILFLHGSDERGDGKNELERVKVYGLPKVLKTRNPFSEDVFVIAPRCPEETRWIDHIEALKFLLDDAIERYDVEAKRIYLTGLSLGGQGVWFLGAAYPDLFAALVPICGRSHPKNACALKEVPIWVFHGAKDDRVPLVESTEMVEAVNACGGNATLTVYPEVGHVSWGDAYDTPELYRWLLEQRS